MDCWIWIASRNGQGYGNFKINGQSEKAHRVAYKLVYGEIPGNLYVLHTCDNPSCCNPLHLFLGSQADNVQDMCVKGRKAKGERSGRTKLKERDVKKIRFLVKNGMTQTGVGRMFGVRPNTIHGIINRRTWKHI